MTTRLFTFGCSFTNYGWATWADIMGQEFTEHQNWGQCGAGNLFILCSLMEAIQKESISKDDTVAIMWSSITREDRWINGEWITPGTVFNPGSTDMFSEEWLKKYADPLGYLIRDLALVSAAVLSLEKIGCKYHMLSMMPFDVPSEVSETFLKKIKSKFNLWSGAITNTIEKELDKKKDDVMSMYSDMIDKIRPSVFEVIFNRDWYSRKGFKQQTWAELSYRENIKTWAPHWPPYEEFIKGEVDDANVLDEIKQCYDIEDIQSFITEIKRFENRDDVHPTPLEHLEYLEKVLPEFSISDATRIWTEQQHLNAEKGIEFNSKLVDRL